MEKRTFGCSEKLIVSLALDKNKKREKDEGIKNFLRLISDSHSRYFNTKYTRKGSLFEGRFKALRVENDSQLLHLSRYIHLNPLPKNPNQPSSYPDYLGFKHTTWIQSQEILGYFENPLSYQSFVEDYTKSAESLLELEGLTLE